MSDGDPRQHQRDQLANHIKHDIRNLAASLHGNLRLLSEQSIPESAQELLNATIRAAQLLNEMLDVDLISGGAIDITPGETSLLSLRRTLLDVLQGEATRKGIKLNVATVGDHRPLRVPVRPTFQVLMNLIHNAVKQTAAGTVDVMLEWHTQSEPGMLRATVRDSGPGLPAELLATMASGAETAVTATFLTGIGIGLKGSQSLVNLMGGSLTASNRDGAGAEFLLSLPCTAAKDADAPAACAGDVVLLSDDGTLSGTIASVQGINLVAISSEQGIAGILRALSALPPNRRHMVVVDSASPPARIASLASLNEAEHAAGFVAVFDSNEGGGLPTGFQAALHRSASQLDWRHLFSAYLARPEPRPVHRPAAASEETPLAGKVVLVADDSPEFLLYSNAILNQCGASAITVPTFREAFEIMLDPPQGLVMALLDFHTLTETADVLIRRLRSEESNRRSPRLPVLVMSAEQESRLFLRLQTAGADGFLAKPFTREQLQAAALDVIGGGMHFQRRRQSDTRSSKPETLDNAVNPMTIRAASIFLDQLPSQVRAVVDSVEALNFDHLHKLLHRMVGSAGLGGFTEMVEVCRSGMELTQTPELDVWCPRFLEVSDACLRSKLKVAHLR